ncbi:MAG: 4Fe-4S binding protein, partial [Chloroflexi bacterium]
PGRVNLINRPWLKRLLTSRWPQFLARAVTLAGFVFVILAGLSGSRVGSHNFAIIFVWIAWWTALKLVFIPLGGRSWCSICPIPMPGEWLQRGFDPHLTSKTGRRGFGLRWPKMLRSSWLQSSGFLLIGLFTAVTLTDPRVTALVLLGLIALAIGLSLVFENRAFCSYVCPIGGFTGLYAKTSPIELRVGEPCVCAAHKEKDCYTACPWGLYPLSLKDSSACGLCMECLRACPKDNIAVNLRPFGSDLRTSKTSARLDETFLALGMLGSALVFAAVFTGPWGALKTAAFQIGSTSWFGYAAGLLALNLGVLPGLFTLAVWIGQKWSGNRVKIRQAVARQAQMLLPLGLCAWISFTVSFAFPKANFVLKVLSDPLGWGWNLFGTAGSTWSPDVAAFSPALQAGLLLLGLVWSIRVARDLAQASNKQAYRQQLPVMVFSLLFSLSMLWLLIG